MVRYAITDGRADHPGGVARLLERAKRWAAEGIDFVQLREKNLCGGALLELAEAMSGALRGSGTKLLINGRPDIAVASGAHGVHLTASPGELTPAQVRLVFAAAGLTTEPIVSVACHNLAEVQRAADGGADLILFGPVFEKRVKGEVVWQGFGVSGLADACHAAQTVRVLALGGVTSQNTADCVFAGVGGVAGIRLFE